MECREEFREFDELNEGEELRDEEGDDTVDGGFKDVAPGEAERGRFGRKDERMDTGLGVTSSLGRTIRFSASIDGDIIITPEFLFLEG